jgi:cyanophycin synthetase
MILDMDAPLALFSLLIDRVRRKPETTAVIYRDQAVSYAALATGALKLANALEKQGVMPGQRIGMGFHSSPLALMLLFALARLGACVVPLSLGRDEASRAEIARKFGVDMLIVENEKALMPGWPALQIHSVSISSQDVEQTKQLLEQQDASAHQGVAEMPWFVVLSSGSTGVPKGVALTQTQAWERIRQSLLPWTEATRVLPYDLAIGAGLFPALRALAAGGTVIITEDADFSGGFAEFATRHRATHVMSSPWMAAQLLAQLSSQTDAMPTVEYLWIAGGHCSRRVLEGLMERATPNVWVKYASAEIGVVAAGPAGELLGTPGLTGQLGAWVEADALDEAGNALPADSTGLLRFRGAGWPQTYADEQDNAENAFKEGWFYSKDYGRVLPDGRLVVEGRAEGLLNLAGIRIQAEYFEELLIARLGLRECALFVALRDDGSNVLVVAVNESDAQHAEAIKKMMLEHLDNLASDACRVFLVPVIPRTPLGKVARRQLQQNYLAFLKALGDV